ncbi:DnaJ sub C member 7, partial [Chytridiales sp. JEL 0842]
EPLWGDDYESDDSEDDEDFVLEEEESDSADEDTDDEDEQDDSMQVDAEEDESDDSEMIMDEQVDSDDDSDDHQVGEEDDLDADFPKIRYTGFHPPAPTWKPDRIDPTTIDPELFYAKYISTRTPCILTKPLPDASWLGSTKWKDLSYLAKKAGDCVVEIEAKASKSDRFGKGRHTRRQVIFKDFLKDVEEGNEELYLSTQYGDPEAFDEQEVDEKQEEEEEEEDEEDRDEQELLDLFQEYCKPPVQYLLSDFPLRPKLMDFADNLYIVISGQKTFTVFSPADAEKMYTHSLPTKIHRNGLITYAHPPPRADGADRGLVKEWKLKEAVKRLEDQSLDEKERREARADVERRLVALMEEEGMGEQGEWEEEEFEGEGIDGEEDDDDEEMGLEDDYSEEEQDDDDDEDGEEQEPPSFSQIDLETLHSKTMDSEDFPLLSQATKVTFTLNEGEMLYLPASWFHEVRSHTTKGSKEKVSMAFNYWFHPPTTPHFHQPYTDSYWSSSWDKLEAFLDAPLEESDGESGVREAPLAVRLAGCRPGVWFVRDVKTGKYLGEAQGATLPMRFLP